MLISLILTLLVGLFILIGTIYGLSYKNNKEFTDFSISVAFGVILGLIILEIIPECFSILSDNVGTIRSIISIILLTLIGIILLKILDLFIPHHTHEATHHHKHKDDSCHNNHLHHIGIISSVAMIIHNIIEGMSLYLVSKSNITSGMLLCVGIGLHNIPMGLIIASTLSNSNYQKNKIIKISLIVSVSTFVGGLFMWVLGGVNELVEGVLLGITLGMLVYIAIFELLSQICHMNNKKLAKIGVIGGFLLLIISTIIEHFVG
ncbi:MAG: ZIP family metal transporter [bacterium]|nr:ZIP family metal transporter [bacterium]